MRYLLALLVPVILAGCASTMNKDQCLVADWRTVGYEDGSAGRSAQWLERRGEDCAKHGIAPDLDAYLSGRDDGLVVFCRPRRGFDIGRRGGNYGNVCPADLEGAFLVAYQDGKGLYDRQYRYNALNNEISNTIAGIDALESDIAGSTVELATADMTIAERADLAVTLKNMAEDRGRLKERLPQLEAEREDALGELEGYRDAVLPRYPGAS